MLGKYFFGVSPFSRVRIFSQRTKSVSGRMTSITFLPLRISLNLKMNIISKSLYCIQSLFSATITTLKKKEVISNERCMIFLDVYPDSSSCCH